MALRGNNPYKYFGKKLAHTLLTRMGVSGFLFGPLQVLMGFVFELGLVHGVYKIDQAIISGFNEADKKAYLDLIEVEGLSEKEKEKYKKTFLNKLSNILSVKKFIKK